MSPRRSVSHAERRARHEHEVEHEALSVLALVLVHAVMRVHAQPAHLDRERRGHATPSSARSTASASAVAPHVVHAQQVGASAVAVERGRNRGGDAVGRDLAAA